MSSSTPPPPVSVVPVADVVDDSEHGTCDGRLEVVLLDSASPMSDGWVLVNGTTPAMLVHASSTSTSTSTSTAASVSAVITQLLADNLGGARVGDSVSIDATAPVPTADLPVAASVRLTEVPPPDRSPRTAYALASVGGVQRVDALGLVAESALQTPSSSSSRTHVLNGLLYGTVVNAGTTLRPNWFGSPLDLVVEAVAGEDGDDTGTDTDTDTDDVPPSSATTIYTIGLTTSITVGPAVPPPTPSLTSWLSTIRADADATLSLPLADVETLLRPFCLSHRMHAVLLTGPSGVGKTHTADALATSSGLAVHRVSGVGAIRAGAGASELALQRTWDAVSRTAPCVLLLDDVDTLAPAVSQSPLQRRLTWLLLRGLDTFRDNGVPVLVLATSSSPSAILPAVLTPTRVGAVLTMEPPTADLRHSLLLSMCRRMTLESPELLPSVVASTTGFVAADLQALCREAFVAAAAAATAAASPVTTATGATTTTTATTTTPTPTTPATASPASSSSPLTVTAEHFAAAKHRVRPSSLRHTLGGKVPSTATLSTLKGIDDVVSKCLTAVHSAVVSPETFRSLGVTPPRGMLLYGPSGIGKTHLAHGLALAFDAQATTLTVRCPDIISKIVGETEQALAAVFAQARAASPAVVVFDQLEVLAPVRSASDAGARTFDRLLSVLLLEMDGIGTDSDHRPVFVIATASDKAALDPAIVRPGRLDQHVELRVPDTAARTAIAASYLSTMDVSVSVGEVAEKVAERTGGWTGADIQAVCQAAGMRALRRSLQDGAVCWDDLDAAVSDKAGQKGMT